MTTNTCYYSTNTDPLVNRRVAGVDFLMEAFECAEGASSAGRVADEGGAVTVVTCTHSAYCCRLLDMKFSKEFPFEFTVQSYGCTKLNVMYTNDTDSVKLCLASVLWLH